MCFQFVLALSKYIPYLYEHQIFHRSDLGTEVENDGEIVWVLPKKHNAEISFDGDLNCRHCFDKTLSNPGTLIPLSESHAQQSS